MRGRRSPEWAARQVTGAMLLRMRVVAFVHAVSDAVFAEVDSFAWVQGWQIKRRWHAHTYRDKRFDVLMACRVCTELGSDARCPSCGGTGRVNTLEPPGSRR